MTRVITANEVEASAAGADGQRQLAVADGVLVTPLARDRAAALGVTLVSGNGRAPVAATPPPPTGRGGGGAGVDLARLRAESVVRSVTRQVLLREGIGLGALEEVVGAVNARLQAPDCGCGCAGSGRCR